MLMFQECCFEIYLCFCVNLFPLIYFMGNQQLVMKLINQAEDGARKQFWLQIDQTKYTDDNKEAMALLYMLIERKDKITKRLHRNIAEQVEPIIGRLDFKKTFVICHMLLEASRSHPEDKTYIA